MDRRLLLAMAFNETVFVDLVEVVDLITQPAEIVQKLAEKAIAAVKKFSVKGSQGIDLKRLNNMLNLNED